MAIDMSTVKAITHNNKDVTKIQDSLGNVLWQKEITTQYRQLSNLRINASTNIIGIPCHSVKGSWRYSFTEESTFTGATYYAVYLGSSDGKFIPIRFNYARYPFYYFNSSGSNYGAYTLRGGTALLQLTCNSSGWTAYLYVDNTLKGSKTGTAVVADSSTRTISLFDRTYAIGYFYSCSFTASTSEGTSLNLLPAQRKSDNVCGVYDTISNVFYPSYGNKTNIGGSVVNENPSGWL